ncbi:MAG: DUF5597 domain-containing protein [Ferruginibacter sp.]
MNLNRTTSKFAITSLIFLATSFTGFSQQIPKLEKRGDATQLIVDGKPYLVLGGELHNSSSSSLEYLDLLWKPLKAMNLNTVLASVSWQLIEPQEGKFDFSLVDGILKGAREQNLRVILLWFGSWKNGLSHYAPDWVKVNYKRFPRIVLDNGRSSETISALSTEAANTDAKAFAGLMNYIKTADNKQRTVLMVQVENEVGIIGSTRDHSAMANAAMLKPVPAELIKMVKENTASTQSSLKQHWETAGKKTSGNWIQIFGENDFADEAFMAWSYARYINTVAAAGKAAYNIPMYVNAWIVQPEDKRPGDYPSGGPQSHMHDIWHVGATALDILCPDIYLPDFKKIVNMYQHSWNPLFIPESFSGIDGAANAFYAIGKNNGIGYSPFGIDYKTDEPTKTPLAKAYEILSQLSPEILKAQSTGSITAVSLNKSDSMQTLELGGYTLQTTLRKNWSGVTQADKGYCIIINSGKDEFIIAGADVDVNFVPASPGPKMAGLSSVYEGKYVNGIWKAGRLLNGDDIMVSYKLADEAAANRTGTGARLNTDPTILKVKLYRYE